MRIDKIKSSDDNSNILYKYFILGMIGIIIAIILYLIIFGIYYYKQKCHEKKEFGDYLKSFNVKHVCSKLPLEEQEYDERVEKDEEEVYYISNQNLTYDQAKCKCAAYGGRLATKNEIIQAYNKGAEWCGYGWSDGQTAYYPTQQCTWDKLQKGPKKDRDSCGKPGINGGYFASPDIKFGANCYGIKPKGEIIKPKKPFCKKKSFCSLEKNKNASSRLSVDDISGFNNNKWSEYD